MKKDNYLIILVPGLIPRQKRIFQADTSAAEVDVYVAGADSVFQWVSTFSSTLGIAAYWKNGKPADHTRRSQGVFGPDGAVATSIAVSGADVYVTGYQESCGPNSCNDYGSFWNNGASFGLYLPNYPSSLCISNNDIYIAGSSLYLTGTGGNAAYLKNDVKVDLPSGSAGAISTAIVVSGNDAYVAGREWNSKSYQDASGNTFKKSVAKYWKNGNVINLTDGTNGAQAWSIAVSGTDVYVAGTEWNGKSYQMQRSSYIYQKSIAIYWKNGKAINLTDGIEDGQAKSITISGNDVYVAGTVAGYATYWKNGIAVTLSNVESETNSFFLVKK